jgi:hypothetical protein
MGQGWIFGLTPLTHLSSVPIKVIREILSELRPFVAAIKMGSTDFFYRSNFFALDILVTPHYNETCISYLCNAKIQQ